MSTTTTPEPGGQSLAQRLLADKHTALIGVGASLLTGAVLYFNGSYGLSISYGMCAAFIGAAVSKDACIAFAWSARGKSGRVAAAGVGLLAFTISALAAIGAASHGRQEAADPKAQQIAAYEMAAKRAQRIEARLAEIGSVPPVAELEAKAASALASVPRAIAGRTRGCTVLDPQSNGPRQIAVNRTECQPVIEANARVGVAREAQRLQADLDAQQAILSKGRPASADAQASTLAALFGLVTVLKGIEGIQAWTNLFVGLALEVMSSLSWAAFAAALAPARLPASAAGAAPAFAAASTFAGDLADGRTPDEVTFAASKAAATANVVPDPMFAGDLPDPTEPPRPRKRRKPQTSQPANVVTFAEHPAVRAIRANGGTVASNAELARLMGCCDGEASRRWREVADRIDVRFVGRRREFRLRA